MDNIINHSGRAALGKVEGNAVSKRLEEKVLQFGTGVLLRGLPDYFIDKANKQGIFNGSILVVKSTDSAGVDSFDKQDGLYTICVRGIEHGQTVEDYILNESISRVLSANEHWDKVLEAAHNPALQLVISNTTEVGIVPVDDNIHLNPPPSFPGKLLAFLYERYKAFDGAERAGLVIIPTELIVDNADTLKTYLNELAIKNQLEEQFINWMNEANHFCNSLVDRIVPGKLNAEDHKDVMARLGYRDELMILAESFRLWAIESDHPHVKEVLSFAQVDDGVVIAADINKFRELKLRLLNGTHSFCCAYAFLQGFETVKQAMADSRFQEFIHQLMIEEIVPAVINEEITREEAESYAYSVMDRFRNPFLDHKWLSISLNYTSKMFLRNVPLITRYYQRMNAVPVHMAEGFGAYLRFMKCNLKEDGKYYGQSNGKEYLVQDEMAGYFSNLWSTLDTGELVNLVLSDTELWKIDLRELPGFEEAVIKSVGPG